MGRGREPKGFEGEGERWIFIRNEYNMPAPCNAMEGKEMCHDGDGTGSNI